MLGWLMLGWLMLGWLVLGWRVLGWLMLGWLMLGWLMLGWLMLGWLMLGWLMLGWLMLGWLMLGWLVSTTARRRSRAVAACTRSSRKRRHAGRSGSPSPTVLPAFPTGRLTARRTASRASCGGWGPAPSGSSRSARAAPRTRWSACWEY